MTDSQPSLTSPITTMDDGVALVTLDDGKANAISHAVLEGVHAALDAAEGDDATAAVVIAGRPGKFSAGFDLSVMTESEEAMRGLVGAGAQLLARIASFPLPVVAAGTGHALAAGALMLLACDTRVGAEGAFKIGLNEVGIGMPLPQFALELAQERLDPQQLVAATLQAQVYDPAGALAAGYLDELVPPDAAVATAVERAKALAGLRRGAYAQTKARLRGPVSERIRSGLETDLSSVGTPTP